MKKVILFLGIVSIGIVVSSFKNSKKSEFKFTFEPETIYTAPTEEESFFQEVNIPFNGKSFNGFREAVAFKESQGRYHVVNSYGYLGKYQFGKSTLQRFKIYNTKKFLNTPELQEDAFVALCSLNKWILRKDIKRSVGKKIRGIEITESGILAAAHLAGAGNVKKYLRSSGKLSFEDGYGSSVHHYMELFSGFDTSFIEANKKPVL
jgi:hypothetical protein